MTMLHSCTVLYDTVARFNTASAAFSYVDFISSFSANIAVVVLVYDTYSDELCNLVDKACTEGISMGHELSLIGK